MPGSEAEDVKEAVIKLKEIIAELEDAEKLEKIKTGDLKFEIKREEGVQWYVAYGT